MCSVIVLSFTTHFISRLASHRPLSLLLVCVPFCSFFHTCLACTCFFSPRTRACYPQSIVLAIAPALHRAPHPQSSFLPKAVQSPPILLSTHSPPCPSSLEHLACHCTHSLARATSPKLFHPEDSVFAIRPLFTVLLVPKAVYSPFIPLFTVPVIRNAMYLLSALLFTVLVILSASCSLSHSLFTVRHIH